MRRITNPNGMIRLMSASLLLLTSLLGQASPNAYTVNDAQSKGTVQTRTGRLDYEARASQLVLKGPEGEPECRMFHVTYSKAGSDPAKRPVTFCFNGGPGSATIWLHMGGLGPVMAPLEDDGAMPSPPYDAIPNPDTWLDFTDLVFIDAPNTGFSRLLKPDLARKYFGVRPDIAAFTSFIKAWLTENKRWNSPLFLAGESYGGIRGSGLSKSLFDAGIYLNGFISISGTNSYLTLRGMRGNLATYLGFFPTMAATAWHHGRLGKRFKSVEQVAQESMAWVEDTYASALVKGDSLSQKEKEAVAAKMSEFLGVSKEYCLGANLKVSEGEFFKELLRDKGLAVGRLDSRYTGKEELKTGRQRSDDPSSEAITGPYLSSFRSYAQNQLGITTEMDYSVFGNVSPWTSVEGAYAETGSDLRMVLASNRHFRVLYACGYYDLACPFYSTIYSVNQMGLDEETRKQISYSFYPSGHMMYVEKASRRKLAEDVRLFVQSALGRS